MCNPMDNIKSFIGDASFEPNYYVSRPHAETLQWSCCSHNLYQDLEIFWSQKSGLFVLGAFDSPCKSNEWTDLA